ncbi:MAG: hypothetical protein ACYDHE_11225 [Candidatus Acidiferrales bacterium]
MSTAKVVMDQKVLEEINAARESFDLLSPLTEAELEQVGMLGTLPGVVERVETAQEMPLLREIEDTEEPATDAVEAFVDRNGYNAQYTHYMKCQALAALVAFTEGWSAFEEMALKRYLIQVKRENDEYRGTDPNKAFSLRIRQQAVEDFTKFIRAVMNEAITTPKPALVTK